MTNAYELNNIRVFHSDRCVLDVPQLSIPTGKSIALLGDNGAGKSTLLDLLAFIKKPTEGTLSLQDSLINSTLSVSQRQKIAYVSQHPLLLSGTVSDNLRLALKLQNIPAKQHKVLEQQALALVNLTHYAHHQASQLSGGELRRAAIARAICYQPEIILLDEPFSHLDQDHIKQLEVIISQIAKDKTKTVIFSTHDRIRGTALSDMTINLVNGKTTQSPLVNVYSGTFDQHYFNTGHIRIHTTEAIKNSTHIAIHPNEIIISHQPLESSMRNQFWGQLIAIKQEYQHIQLSIDCGEVFHVIITPESLTELKLNLSDKVWISFKSNAVTLF
jgi:tungstate transport system ATP-binding protein